LSGTIKNLFKSCDDELREDFSSGNIFPGNIQVLRFTCEKTI
jgi:hypothetical protein